MRKLVLAASSLCLLASCQNAPLISPSGDIARSEISLIATTMLLMSLIAIPLIAATFYFAWRYRAANADRVGTERRISDTTIEKAVWGAPLVIVSVLAVLNWTSAQRLDPYRSIDPSIAPLTIQVVAFDWKWLFIYPEQGVAAVNLVVIPEGRPVDFRVTSQSVMNSFFIPTLGSQIYAMAGMETQVHLVAERTGIFEGMSANFSGDGFSDMRFTVRSLAPSDFDAWVGDTKGTGNVLNSQAISDLSNPSANLPGRVYGAVESGAFKSILDGYAANGRQIPSMAMN